MDHFTVGWSFIAAVLFVAALVNAHRRGTPRGYTPLPDLGNRLEPMSLQPLGSIWKRKETDL